MKKLLVFFLFISNFIFSQNHIQTALEIDNYCNEIFNDKKFEKYINPENIAENIKGNEHEYSRENER